MEKSPRAKRVSLTDRHSKAALRWLNRIAGKDTPDGIHAKLLLRVIEQLTDGYAANTMLAINLLKKELKTMKAGETMPPAQQAAIQKLLNK